MNKGARLVDWEEDTLTLRLPRQLVRVPYREILTAEHLPHPWRGLRLHVSQGEAVRVRCWGRRRIAIENELRRRGVRIVDEYGAMITPTLLDFMDELANEPARLRQSSDDA